MYIKYLLATSPESGSRPSEGRYSRLKTTTRRSINPLRMFYAVKFSCIHGGRNYKATGKVRKTSYVLFLGEKKRSSYVLLGESRHLRPSFLCNERVFQHDRESRHLQPTFLCNERVFQHDRESRHLRPTFLCNERVFQNFCTKFWSSWLEVVACSQGKLRCKRLES